MANWLIRVLLVAGAACAAASASAAGVQTLFASRTTAGTSVEVRAAGGAAAQLSVGTCGGYFDLVFEGFIGAWEAIEIGSSDGHLTKADVAASTSQSWAIPPGYQKVRATIAPGISSCTLSVYVAPQ